MRVAHLIRFIRSSIEPDSTPRHLTDADLPHSRPIVQSQFRVLHLQFDELITYKIQSVNYFECVIDVKRGCKCLNLKSYLGKKLFSTYDTTAEYERRVRPPIIQKRSSLFSAHSKYEYQMR